MDLGFEDPRGLAGAEPAPVLRRLHWAEFCARLEAAQDLRRLSQVIVPAWPGGSHLGSFHRVAAGMLQGEGSEERVNRKYSKYGKAEESTLVTKAYEASPPAHDAFIRRELP